MPFIGMAEHLPIESRFIRALADASKALALCFMVVITTGVVVILTGEGRLPIDALLFALSLFVSVHAFVGFAAIRSDGAAKQKALAAMISVWLALIVLILLWVASALVYALLRLW
jgi:hypothetical protein